MAASAEHCLDPLLTKTSKNIAKAQRALDMAAKYSFLVYVDAFTTEPN